MSCLTYHLYCSARKANNNHEKFDSDIIKTCSKERDFARGEVRLADVGNRTHRSLTAAVGISFALNRADKWHGHTTLETWPVRLRAFLALAVRHCSPSLPREMDCSLHYRQEKENVSLTSAGCNFPFLFSNMSDNSNMKRLGLLLVSLGGILFYALSSFRFTVSQTNNIKP